jgi:Tol biopolymer transport system component
MAAMGRHRGEPANFRRWGLAALLAGPCIWACPQTAGAQSFVFTQITDTTGSTFSANGESSLSASGTRIAFSSDRNLVNPVSCPVLPGNADLNREVYLFDTTTGCYTQVTSGLSPTTSSSAPSLDAAGTRVAFFSRANLVNPGGCPVLPGNADTSGEIYLFDFTSGCYVQVTDTPSTPGFGNGVPSISRGGTRVAFSSDLNLVNPGGCPVLPGNADGNLEIYVFDTTTACYVQVTNTTGGGPSSNLFASLNADGTRVAFQSDRNLVNPGGCPILPGNADGNLEVYLFDTTTGCYVQVTNTTGGIRPNTLPRLSAAGTRVVFESNRNLVNPGGCPVLPGNADGNREVYLFDTTTGCYTQVTNGSGAFSVSPSLDAAGTRIVFESGLDLVNPVGCPVLPGNADANAEVYLFDTSTGCYTQVTDTTGPIGPPFVGLFPSINADGTRIAFQSREDTTDLSPCAGCPGNSDGNLEIFLASITPSGAAVSIPTLSEWTRLAMVVILTMGAFLPLKRRRVR